MIHKTVFSDSTGSLDRAINALLADGWTLRGSLQMRPFSYGASRYRTHYCQVLIKETNEDKDRDH